MMLMRLGRWVTLACAAVCAALVLVDAIHLWICRDASLDHRMFIVVVMLSAMALGTFNATAHSMWNGLGKE